MDQMKKVMEEMKDNMRMTNPIKDLVHRTDSPFTASINGHPLPSKFKLPSLDSYNGTRDPFDHIATFKTTMHLQGVPDEIMCRAFPTTLKGPARVWFSKITPKFCRFFRRVKQIVCQQFHWGAETQAFFVQLTDHRTRGERKPAVIHHSLQQRSP